MTEENGGLTLGRAKGTESEKADTVKAWLRNPAVIHTHTHTMSESGLFSESLVSRSSLLSLLLSQKSVAEGTSRQPHGHTVL